MRKLRQIAVRMIVWATSASTLMAATPFVACGCPNGDLKPFCFLSASTKASCCGTGTCCSSQDGECQCCKAKSGAKSRNDFAERASNSGGEEGSQSDPGGNSRLVKAKCQKVLVQVKSSSA